MCGINGGGSPFSNVHPAGGIACIVGAAEQSGTRRSTRAARSTGTDEQSGVAWREQETRFIASSTTGPCSPRQPPTGSVNGMHDNYAIGGMIPMLLMQLGEWCSVGRAAHSTRKDDRVCRSASVIASGRLMVGRTPGNSITSAEDPNPLRWRFLITCLATRWRSGGQRYRGSASRNFGSKQSGGPRTFEVLYVFLRGRQ